MDCVTIIDLCFEIICIELHAVFQFPVKSDSWRTGTCQFGAAVSARPFWRGRFSAGRLGASAVSAQDISAQLGYQSVCIVQPRIK